MRPKHAVALLLILLLLLAAARARGATIELGDAPAVPEDYLRIDFAFTNPAGPRAYQLRDPAESAWVTAEPIGASPVWTLPDAWISLDLPALRIQLRPLHSWLWLTVDLNEFVVAGDTDVLLTIDPSLGAGEPWNVLHWTSPHLGEVTHTVVVDGTDVPEPGALGLAALAMIAAVVAALNDREL